MKEFGGYFGLELHQGPYAYHQASLALKSGRASLHYILNYTKPSTVYVPYYTCDALLEPFALTNTTYKFYEINELLEPVTLPVLGDNEYFIYINYFDLKRDFSDQLSARYGDKLIIDCTQAFFMKGNRQSWLFNSCRKFFGTPDGSYLYAPAGKTLPAVDELNEHYLTEHLLKRFNGHTTDGYADFTVNETYCDSTVLQMSKLSGYLLSHIDYKAVIEKRRSNYKTFQQAFGSINTINLDIANDAAPMFYPFLTKKLIDKRSLHQQNIFVPTLWNDVLTRLENEYAFEKDFANRLIPLPIDHRYQEEDIQLAITAISKLL